MTWREFVRAWWYRNGGVVLWAVLFVSLGAGMAGATCLIWEVKGEAR